ncbi:NB-ARC domain-containing protein [Kitasatospora sp. LaBMicrA B282]
MCGPGGFGKTTLVTQLCGDLRVQELFPEILWVETGRSASSAESWPTAH